MKAVADKLTSLANDELDVGLQNLYGRSAFNRYYYCIFLVTRDLLREYKVEWSKSKHKQIPDILVVTFKKELIKEVKKTLRHNLVTESEASKAITQIRTSTAELSSLLIEAYDARCIADYEPEVLLNNLDKNLLLGEYKLNTASTWPSKAQSYCKSIRRILKDYALV